MFKFPEFDKAFAGASAMDFEVLAQIQRKNFDAVVAAQAKMAEGFQLLLRRQAEQLQAGLKDGIEAARHNLTPANVAKVDLHLDYLRSSAERSVANARELADIVGKSGGEAVEILRQRATDSVGEISQVVKTA